MWHIKAYSNTKIKHRHQQMSEMVHVISKDNGSAKSTLGVLESIKVLKCIKKLAKISIIECLLEVCRD